MNTVAIVSSSQGPHSKETIRITFGRRDQFRITAVVSGLFGAGRRTTIRLSSSVFGAEFCGTSIWNVAGKYSGGMSRSCSTSCMDIRVEGARKKMCFRRLMETAKTKRTDDQNSNERKLPASAICDCGEDER